MRMKLTRRRRRESTNTSTTKVMMTQIKRKIANTSASTDTIATMRPMMTTSESANTSISTNTSLAMKTRARGQKTFSMISLFDSLSLCLSVCCLSVCLSVSPALCLYPFLVFSFSLSSFSVCFCLCVHTFVHHSSSFYLSPTSLSLFSRKMENLDS
eukprot:m.140318 g.140318  ORF g.140318 m.140318 type:complete len:156 (-) comp14946_c0_seq11:1594-2061(-)